MLDFPETGEALWALYDRGGPRPEYVLPVLWSESGFEPSIQNRAGAPYYGVGQTSGASIESAGVDLQDFLSWPASEQIARFVGPFYLNQAKVFGRIRSGTRAYQLNFLPATLSTARGLDDVLVSYPSRFYMDNSGLDWQNKGTITVRDLAHFIERAARDPHVQSAIQQCYEVRPAQRPPHEPVLGEDFSPSPLGMFAAAAAAAALVFAVVRS